MRRPIRILVEIAAPPFFGAVLFSIPALCFGGGHAVTALGVLFGGAYVLAALPSVLYTLCMEVAFAAGFDPAGKKAMLLSVSLGFLAGVAMAVQASGGDFIRFKTGALVSFPVVGLVVGVLVSMIVRIAGKGVERKNG